MRSGSSLRSSEERALLLLSIVLLVQRAAYLIVIIGVLLVNPAHTYRHPATNAGLVIIAVAWNLVLVGIVRRKHWIPPRIAWADVAIMSALLIATAANSFPEQVYSGMNWSGRLAMGTVALVAAALPLRQFLVAWITIVVVRIGSTTLVAGAFEPPVDEFASIFNGYVWFGLVFYFIRHYLVSQARKLDQLTQQQAELKATEAAAQARLEERLAQHRRLHDTVLTTLTAIARGGLDHRGADVRSRCAAEADYIRRLISTEKDAPDTSLTTCLTDTIRRAETLGLRVRFQHDPVPGSIPAEVVDALCGATGEALNNVAKHSGSADAWVTLTVDAGTISLRVVDRGIGFSAESSPPGFGITQSITARLAEHGGSARIESEPGHGTIVELLVPIDGDDHAETTSSSISGGARRPQ
ncbi:sensor histidine kinase [Lolliginicoccus suaedae]|uniref:sensor histidine kinase n=1 Tax=Lolliginicoccus suaedae TaxID=2605429 RepID=UPI0011EDB09F|nr:ATP-binding protein [Lolliginicoccus suaedae]